ncbi:pirin family protein [candidate division KSB1 bacterium]|nr:pirin family protein [candidate division KSB1 bacterium]
MSAVRKVQKTIKSIPTIEGAGVHLKRAFGFHQKPDLDPFLLLDDFHGTEPSQYSKGFPWHPHRGIETITYLFEGSVEHGDSLGNSGVIRSGDVQWMTAGSGIVHQEMPQGRSDGLMWGLQLWANLPAAQKMMAPRYRDVTRDQIPLVQLDSGVKVKIIAGEFEGKKGAVDGIVIDPTLMDIAIPPSIDFRYELPSDHTVFAYVLQGSAYFDPDRDPFAFEKQGKNYFDTAQKCLIDAENLIIYGPGKELAITAGESGARFVLVAGKPLGEPIAWGGPIVMNTREELRTAFEELENGTFLKHS